MRVLDEETLSNNGISVIAADHTVIPSTGSPFRHIDRLQLRRVGAGDWQLRQPSDTSVGLFLILALGDDCGVVLEGTRQLIAAGTFCLLPRRAEMAATLVVGEEAVVIFIPDDCVGAWYVDLRTGNPLVVGRDNVMQGVVAQLVESLTGLVDGALHDYSSQGLAKHVIGLISLMYVTPAAGENVGNSALLKCAMEYIESRLDNLEMTPDRIARGISVSTRTLHRLFEREGLTVRGWLRARRLEQCRAELADPRLIELPVSAIAARWGLHDAAHFSRMFKAAFGVSPRAFRLGLVNDHPAQSQLRSA